jgi:tetratricopeptide (TPR) repeat protein
MSSIDEHNIGDASRGAQHCDMLALGLRMISRLVTLGLAAGIVALVPSAGPADPSSPAVQERRQLPSVADGESEYNRGVRARVAKDWAAAVSAFHQALALRSDFPDAWNELGYALRNQGRYAESLDAYHEALRLRPNFPEALEYLGEAYVKMGRLDDARRILDRLRPLDAERAKELAEEIAQAK